MDENTDYSDSIFFGSDECETCGSNYDTLDVSIDRDDDGEVFFYVQFCIGCYGGDSYSGKNIGEAVSCIDRILATYGIFNPDLNEGIMGDGYLSGKAAREAVEELQSKFVAEAHKWLTSK